MKEDVFELTLEFEIIFSISEDFIDGEEGEKFEL